MKNIADLHYRVESVSKTQSEHQINVRDSGGLVGGQATHQKTARLPSLLS